MNYSKNRIYYIVLITLIFALGCSGSKEVDLVKADQLLKSITTYNYGDSRADLSELKTMIHKAHGTSDEGIIEKKLISFIESNATYAGKQFICRQLSITGTSESVPALNKLLLNPKTTDIALYALQRIFSAEADKVLIEALDKMEGKAKTGIINCLGDRRTKAAAKPLGSLATDSNPMIAHAAIGTLGKIGNDIAVKQLDESIMKLSDDLKPVAMDALLKCADTYLKNGKNQQALHIYQKFDNNKVPSTIRMAAIYGTLKADPGNSGTYTLNLLKGKDSKAKEIAIMEIRNLQQKTQLSKIAAQMTQLSPRQQVQLISALADFGDPSIKKYILNSVKSQHSNVRIAALLALTELGNADDIFLLAVIAATGNRAEKEAARESLYRLRGNDINSAISTSIPKTADEIKVELIKSLGERGAEKSVPELLKLTADKNVDVRQTSIKVLGQIASPVYLPQLLEVLAAAKSDDEKTAAILTTALTAKKLATPDKQSEPILQELNTTKDDNFKISLIRVLGKIGANNSLTELRKSLKSDNENIRIASIKALSDWPTSAPINDLQNIATTSQDKLSKILALRGFITLIDIDDKRNDNEMVKLYSGAMKLSERTTEKRMVLSGLSDIRTVQALDTALSYLTQKGIQDEVESAVVKIAGRIRRDHPQEVKQALKKILSVTKNDYIKKRANEMLNRIK